MGVVGSTSYQWDAQSRQLTVRHLYLDDNPTLTPVDTHAVALTVRDDDMGSSGPYEVNVTVANVNPALTTAGNQTLVEGALLDLSSAANPLATFVDKGILDSFKATVDWGDGTPLDGPILQSVNGTGRLLATHVYENSGTFTVTVTLKDDDGGVDTKTFQVSVGNIAPTADLSNNGPVNEGSPATVSFSNQFDPSVADTLAGFRYAYDFNNDGTFDVGNGTYAGSVTDSSQQVPATFLADGPGTRIVKARIIDQDGGYTDYTTTITINNVAPTLVNITVDDATIDEGQTATITATINDPGADTFEVDVNWKDGFPADKITGLGATDKTGVVGGTSYVWDADTRQLTVKHVYLDDNPTLTPFDLYAVDLFVRDDDTAQTGPYTVNVTVSNVAPVLDVVGDQMVNEGALLNLTGVNSPNIGTFTDQGILDSFTATIDWGDGTPLDGPTIMTVNGVGQLGASHTYTDDGVYTVTVSIKDDDGGVDVATFQVTVKNVAPTLVNVVATDDSIDEGQTAEIKATINDPGELDTFSVDVNWKDGLPADTITGLGAMDKSGVVGGTSYVWDADTRQLTVKHLYLDDNPTNTPFDPYAVDLFVRDDDMAQTGPYTVNITVSNVAPELTVVQNQTVNEGSLLNLTGVNSPSIGTFVDQGILDSHTAKIDWGDGTPLDGPTIMTVNGVGKLGASHTYADDGVYTVTVTLKDDDGGTHTQTFQVTVGNVAPTLTLTPSAGSVDEGANFSFDAMFNDPGFDNPLNPGAEKQESFTYDVDWGDGRDAITGQGVADTNGAPGTPSTGAFSGSHVYADDGAYTVKVTIHDDDGGSHTQTFQVTVDNVTPVVTLPNGNQSVNEGALLSLANLATFTDVGFDNPLNPGAEKAESFTYDLDWGDGRDAIVGQSIADNNGSPGVPSSGSIAGSHTYGDNGVYTVTVTVHDDDGGSHTQTFQVTVNNVAPTVTVPNGNQTVNEGTLLSLADLATFTDPGFDNPLNPGAEKSETFTYDLDWGDGRDAISGQSIADTNGSPGVPSSGTIAGSHTYADNGTYTVTVTVHDDDGGSHTQTFQVTVNNVAPTVAVTPSITTINEGQSVSFGANFSDPGFDNPLNPGAEKQESFTYDVNWGDGRDAINGQSVADTNGMPGVHSTGTFAGSHTYADNGTYSVTVTIHDDDGGSHVQMFTVTVLNVDPALTGTSGLVLNEGDIFTLTGLGVGLTDPGFDNPLNTLDPANGGETAETFEVTRIDWGDGLSDDNSDADASDLVSIVDRVSGGVGVPTTAKFSHTAHAYADNGNYTVTITVRDDDGGLVNLQFTILVNNVDPTLTGTSNVAVNEGQAFTLDGLGVGLTDPGFDNLANAPNVSNGGETVETFTGFSIDWGDGTATTPVAVVDRDSGSIGTPTTAHFDHTAHTYADNGVYTVKITVQDDDGPMVTRELTITVNNVDPSLTGTTNLVVNESQAFTLEQLGVGLSDPGFDNLLNAGNAANGGETQETFTGMSIDWGDGTTTTPVSVVNRVSGSPGVLTTAHFDHGAHTYADNGVYTVTVTVQDDDGPVVARQFTITVNNLPPKLNPFPNGKKLEGDDINTDGLTTIRLSLHDPGFDNSLNQPNAANGGESYETFTYIVDWGDQTVDAIHLYTSGGSKSVTVTMDGVTTFTGTIADSSPLSVLTLVTAQDGLYDQSVAAKLRTFTIDWGDGTTDTVQLLVKDVQLAGAPGAPTLGGFQTFVVAAPRTSGGVGVETVASGEIAHTYIAPPDPLHPTADVPIRLTLVDDDGGLDGGFNDANAVIFISNPGIESTNVAIDTTPDVPRLDLTQRPLMSVANLDAGGLTQLLQVPNVRGGGGEVAATTERYLELRIVYPDGTESEGFKIKDEALVDLRAFFATLPDGKYRIYLIRTENKSERLVIEVDVRRGHVIDVSDDSEGTRDRPPTEEDSNEAVPLDQNPLLEQTPVEGSDGAANGAASETRIIVIRQGDVEPENQEAAGQPGDDAVDRVSISAPLSLALPLAALAAAEPWSARVDTALAEADESAWQRLRRAGRGGRGARPKKLPFYNRMRVPAPLDYNSKN
ncbi:MAG: beta strand repeat-containing protein [Pirellulales bacterium]